MRSYQRGDGLNAWLMIAMGWVVMVAIMSLLWVRQQSTGKSGMVDVAWPLGVGGLSVFFCLGASDGLLARRVLIASLAGVWAVRLSAHIWIRLQHESDDSRYNDLREKWGNAFQAKLFRFYQFQAFGAVLFALPMLLAASNAAALGWLDWIAVTIWVIAVSGESIADRQLQQFKSNAKNKGSVCQAGLWRYSRHPNYFFEWLHWWTYVAFAVSAPLGWLTLLGPICMLYFILYVTGIPPAEASSLKSRGEGYRRYQETTNAFFPGPPKQSFD